VRLKFQFFLSTLTMLCVLACFTEVLRAEPGTKIFYVCEGDACSVVTFTWDQERQQFKVQNDSERSVKVEVSTFAGKSNVIVPPQKIGYLEVKTFNGPYQANYEQ
jgi:hypothetical protein